MVALWVLTGCWLDAAEVVKPPVALDTAPPGPVETDTPDPVDTAPEAPPLAACADLALPRGGDAGFAWRGPLVGAGDDYTLTCTGGDQEDLVFQFEAPRDGCWVLSTRGSKGDTALQVSTSCAALEGGDGICNDDADPLYILRHAEVHRPMRAGETALLAVDSLVGEPQADVTVLAYRGEPVPFDQDLGADGYVSIEDAILADGEARVPEMYHRDCGTGTGSPDRLFRWTAPRTGVWQFEVASDFRSVISVYRPCEASVVTCADEGLSFDGTDVEILTFSAQADETFILRVAGETLPGPGPGAGEFVMFVSEL